MCNESGGKLHHALDPAAEQIDHGLALAERDVDDLRAAVANRADAEKCVWLPVPELPMRTLPGLDLRMIDEPFKLCHGASARTAITGVSTLTRATASKAL